MSPESTELAYSIRYMHHNDIPAVVRIDSASFPMPWSTRTYEFEVGESDHTHMIVVERTQVPPPNGAFERWWRGVSGIAPRQRTIVAYGGLWHFGGRTHISTIASHPKWRGQGFGELAFVAMLRRSIRLAARSVRLEVRVSNSRAQALYKKYGFAQTGLKRAYYHDNDEDAYDMVLDLNNAAATRFIETRYRDYLKQLRLRDTYTTGGPFA
ncbi:MAG: GNAT family N-acetyltransferase [Chloroflexota bacterium]